MESRPLDAHRIRIVPGIAYMPAMHEFPFRAGHKDNLQADILHTTTLPFILADPSLLREKTILEIRQRKNDLTNVHSHRFSIFLFG